MAVCVSSYVIVMPVPNCLVIPEVFSDGLLENEEVFTVRLSSDTEFQDLLSFSAPNTTVIITDINRGDCYKAIRVQWCQVS